MTLLAGDIGGTKTELALFSPEQGPRKPLARAEFPSGNYLTLEPIVREFLDGAGKLAGQPAGLGNARSGELDPFHRKHLTIGDAVAQRFQTAEPWIHTEVL